VLGGGHGAAADACLDDHGAAGESGDDPVPCQEFTPLARTAMVGPSSGTVSAPRWPATWVP